MAYFIIVKDKYQYHVIKVVFDERKKLCILVRCSNWGEAEGIFALSVLFGTFNYHHWSLFLRRSLKCNGPLPNIGRNTSIKSWSTLYLYKGVITFLKILKKRIHVERKRKALCLREILHTNRKNTFIIMAKQNLYLTYKEEEPPPFCKRRY